jgi:Tol biopolymer transport system component
MSDPPESGPERLDSWKEIAAYLRRDVTTVQRWEKREGMPVHRHRHDKLGSVYAFRAELDEWARRRRIAVDGPDDAEPAALGGDAGRPGARTGSSTGATGRNRLILTSGVAAVLALAVALVWWRRSSDAVNPLENARFTKLTDFDGIEQAAAISGDGRFAAFQSDRDGRMDVWMTQIGTGQFVNLTRGAVSDLVNPSVRVLGFSPDGALVTFWARGAGGAGRSDIGVWAVPLLGGPPRPYLEDAAEYAFSPDGARLVYHSAGPGDPLFLRDSGSPGPAREIFSAPAGQHGHFPLWSSDRSSLYLVLGTPPDRMDVWRLRVTGGAPERVTFHNGTVSHPVLVDASTLLYLATEPDGSGPFIFGLRLGGGTPRRVSAGVETYASLAASADGRRLVATATSPKRTLWRVPVADGRADAAAARRVPLTSSDGSSPRLGPGYLLYVSTTAARDGVWKLEGGAAAEIWSAPSSRVLGAPAIRRDGRRLALAVREKGKTSLYVLNPDGTDVRAVGTGLEPQGGPAWTADGQSLVVAAVTDGVPRLYRVAPDGGDPVPLVREHAQDPACSPADGLVTYTGPDVGTAIPVRAIRTDGGAPAFPAITLPRGSRHVVFTRDGRSLVVLRRERDGNDLWLVDVATGGERRITSLPPDFTVRDFDLSPDGTELVLERAQQQADVVLIERPAR